MKSRELELCEIQQWYPRFKTLSLKTIIHPLSESFIAYLQEDGLFLPRNSEALPSRPTGECEDEDYRRWDEEDDEADEPRSPSFPELEAAVAASIAALDGSVFPKLNWSAPKDSAWISSHGNLKCTNFGEICLLLKASDSLVHDLCHAYDSCENKTSQRPRQFFLALRKWYDLRPEMEFRGFVKQGLLVGVSQREVTGFYPALLESRETLDNSIFQFFVDCLSETFELEDYTFDCYVTRAGKVKLVDFNPWGAFTLSLLFTWDELEDAYARFKGVHARSADADVMPLSATCNGSEHTSSTVRVVRSVQAAMEEEKQGRDASGEPDADETAHFPGHDVGGPSKKTASDNGFTGCYMDGESTSADNGITSVASSIDDSAASWFCHASSPEARCDSNDKVGIVSDRGSGSLRDGTTCLAPGTGRKRANIVLREQGFKAEFRIVESKGHVQVNLRVGGGVPYDYVQTGPGSAWDDFLRQANEEMQQQNSDAAAGG